MQCDKCKYIEMKMDKIENEKMYFKCRRCNNEKIVDIKEIENTENKNERK